MSRNMNNLDRGLRSSVVAPVAIILAIVLDSGSIAILLFASAAVMLAASAVGFCPLHTLPHLNTRGRSPLPH
jgi:hypothetical protein